MRKTLFTLCAASLALTSCQGSVVDYSRLDDLAAGDTFMETEYFDCERFATDEECDAAYEEYEKGYDLGLQLSDELDPKKDENWLFNQCLPFSEHKREGCLDAVGWKGTVPETTRK